MSLLEELITYSEDVINGVEVACIKHKWACARFLTDLNKKDFKYVFDEEKAERFLEWMRLFKHTKGVLQGENIEPHIIQKFVFGNIYGWVNKETGLRRFKKAYWQVGRKNAKSQSLGAMGSYESMAFGENASEVYCAATKKDQAKIVWNEIKSQLKSCEFLNGKYKVAYGQIEHIKSSSFIKALSKDDGKTGDGLNIQCGIVDEYHGHPTSEIYDVLISGTGARMQPLIMIITTAGFNLNHPCYQVEYKYVSRILDPESVVENDEYFVMINELDKDDDIKDEKNWLKANPILASYSHGINFLRGELKSALDVPEKMRNFLTKNMNVWVDQKDNGYMDMAKWNKCKAYMPELSNLDCIVGIDLSSKLDLSSITFEFTIDGKYLILSHSFMPEDRIAEKRNSDRVPYELWIEQGWITATPGSVIDYRFIEKYIVDFAQEYNFNIKEICFDPYNATQFANELMDKGYTCVEIRQGMQTLSEATKDFREQVYMNNLFHDGNPVLSWAVGNAVTKIDVNENIMLDKNKSIERIDPIASAINAHVRTIAYKENSQSVYEERGLIFF